MVLPICSCHCAFSCLGGSSSRLSMTRTHFQSDHLSLLLVLDDCTIFQHQHQQLLKSLKQPTWTCCEPTPHSHRHFLLSCSLSASSPPLPPRGSHSLDDFETPGSQRGLCSPGIAETASSCHRPPQKSAPRPHRRWVGATGGRRGACPSFVGGRFHGGRRCTRCSRRGGGSPGSRGSTQFPFAPVCCHLGSWLSCVKQSNLCEKSI